MEITAGPSFAPGKPRLLFDTDRFYFLPGYRNYDVTPDGKGFIMVQPDASAQNPTQLVVVLNWAEELRRRLAVIPSGR